MEKKSQSRTFSGTSPIFLGNELFQVTYYELGLMSGSGVIRLKLFEPLKFFELYSSLLYFKPCQTSFKARGLDSDLGPGSLGLFTASFFFRPRPSGQVGYPF